MQSRIENLNLVIGQLLRKARKTKDVSIKELSKFLQLRPESIRQMENGTIAVPTGRLIEMLKYLNISALEFTHNLYKEVKFLKEGGNREEEE